MCPDDAAKIIDTIIDSIKANPNQFHFEINVNTTGLSASANGGGIGAFGIAQGGGTGIYASASINDSQIQIAQKKANAAIQQEHQALLDSLSEIASELRVKTPDKTKLGRIYESLKKDWIPGIITSVVGGLITSIAS